MLCFAGAHSTDASHRNSSSELPANEVASRQGKTSARMVMTRAVMRARRLMRRALCRSRSASVGSSMASSPWSRLRVPRAASAIQVFSRACISPRPAIQRGKKMTARDHQGAPKTTSMKATPTAIVSETTPRRRLFRRSRTPRLKRSSGSVWSGIVRLICSSCWLVRLVWFGRVVWREGFSSGFSWRAGWPGAGLR